MSHHNSLIIDLYKNPLNKRKLAGANLIGSGANVTCGDRLRIYAKVKNGKITKASFEGEGCAISIAAASLLTENVKGKSLKSIAKWNEKELFSWLETPLSHSRIKCGLLALETLQTAIKNKN
jgi:nitrogen fixation NifU-like protein